MQSLSEINLAKSTNKKKAFIYTQIRIIKPVQYNSIDNAWRILMYWYSLKYFFYTY